MESSSVSVGNNSIGLHNVFVYGSLQAEDVVQVLLKRIPQSSPAILNNHHRFSIKGRVYPAILPVENKKVTGKVLSGITVPELDVLDAFEDVEYERRTVDVSLVVLSGITVPELDVLDAFEDVEYERRTVDVSLVDNSEKLQAYTYVWRDSTDPNLYGEWDLEEWKRLHMKDFVKMTMGFAEELEQPESKPRVEAYESFYQQNDKKSPMP